MKGSGKIYLHDIRSKILTNTKKRLKRADINNVVFCYEDNSLLEPMKGKFDWIVLDVPCSGTGTLRRNPDIKYKFNRERLEYYVLT
jgi:16S rRNA (cytosine967-C5)-methyltransferase